MLRPNLVSFFNELDTRQGTMLGTFVSFFNELDTGKELCSDQT